MFVHIHLKYNSGKAYVQKFSSGEQRGLWHTCSFGAHAIPRAVWRQVRVRRSACVWAELKWEVFNGLQTSARVRFLWPLTTGGLLSHAQAELGNPCSELDLPQP